MNVNLFSTVTANKLNELHCHVLARKTPAGRDAIVGPADTAMGFATTFRFGNPFSWHPGIDELAKRPPTERQLPRS